MITYPDNLEWDFSVEKQTQMTTLLLSGGPTGAGTGHYIKFCRQSKVNDFLKEETNCSHAMICSVGWIADMTKYPTPIISFIKKSEKFILWHYQYGSKYDTMFWKYAKSLPFKEDDEFNSFLDYSNDSSWYDLKPIEYDGDPAASETYGIWNPYSFKNWYS